MNLVACGAMVVLAGLAGAPPDADVEEPRAEPAIHASAMPVSVPAMRPAAQAPSADSAAVSFRFLTREEGHEILLSDVHVRISDPLGTPLFEGVSNGPFLLAFVPAGRYEVSASHDGRVKRMNLIVAHTAPRSVSLYW